MRVSLHRLSPERWREVAVGAYSVVFGERRPAEMDRIDFTLIATDEKSTPLGYITCREFDAESLYWAWGGTFPGTQGTTRVLPTYRAAIDWAREAGYHRITTLVESANIRYLHLAMRMGFRIIGVRMWEKTVLCELLLNLE